MQTGSQAPKHRRFRFSMRTFLLLFALICLWLGAQVRDARQQEAAVKAALKVAPNITLSAPRILYAHQFTRQGVHDPKIKPIWPKWILDVFGKDLFLRVVGISFDGRNASDVDLRAIVGLRKLRYLDLEYTKTTDDGVALVAEHFPNLVRLDLQVTQITPAAFEYISRLNRLKHLLFGKCDVQDEDLVHLMPLKELEHLALRRTKIRGEGLKYLVPLNTLRLLDLQRTHLTNAAIQPLSQMSQLDGLVLIDTGLPSDSIERLKSALPDCRIVTK